MVWQYDCEWVGCPLSSLGGWDQTNDGAAYTYDGNSLRVEKVSGGTTTVYLFSGSKVIAEYADGSLSKEYIYMGGQLLATTAGTVTTYQHPDHLSTRMATDATGGPVRTFGHFPFGELWYETGTTDKWKFTSYERDGESNNDYALFRSYVNRVGRFSSPDALGGSVADPQTLNRYGYVGNDPMNLGDASGLCPRAGVGDALDLPVVHRIGDAYHPSDCTGGNSAIIEEPRGQGLR